MPILSTFPCQLFDFNSCLLQNGSEKGTLFGHGLKFELKQSQRIYFFVVHNIILDKLNSQRYNGANGLIVTQPAYATPSAPKHFSRVP